MLRQKAISMKMFDVVELYIRFDGSCRRAVILSGPVKFPVLNSGCLDGSVLVFEVSTESGPSMFVKHTDIVKRLSKVGDPNHEELAEQIVDSSLVFIRAKVQSNPHESAFNSGDLINAMMGGNRIPQRGKL